jgi:hypothetical protein
MYSILRCRRRVRVSSPLGLIALFLGLVLVLATEDASAGHVTGRQGRQPTRATARLAPIRSRWSLNFVKKFTIFRVSNTGRQGRQPMQEQPATCRHDSLPFHDALCLTDSTPGGGELRHSEFSLSLVPRGGSPISQSLLRLRHLGCRQAASPQPTLEILFCTWQT